MSNSEGIKSTDFIFEGTARVIFIIFTLLVIFLYFLVPQITTNDITESFNSIREKLFSSSFTFLAILWGSCLTIWSMLKSRSTRYVERIAENEQFIDFIRSFEVRLIFCFFAILCSFYVYIFVPALAFEETNLIIWIWAFSYFLSIGMIIDSLFTARIVLD